MPPVMAEDMVAAAGLEEALRAPGVAGRPALVAYLVGDFPDRKRFREALLRVAEVADAVEVGVPFSDPMADGTTIQSASRAALEGGATLTGLLEELADLRGRLAAPVLLMSYLNPLLARGLPALARDASAAGLAGMIVPDLPLEHAVDMRELLAVRGLALVNMVTPVTPAVRAARLCRTTRGFLYAVTRTGITGGETAVPSHVGHYLAGLRGLSRVPVIAGFGIRTAAQVAALRGQVDGVVVGTALVDAMARGDDPAALLSSLLPAAAGATAA